MPLVSKSFSDIITFTRASSGTYFDATGTLQTATTNIARFDYNPSTLAARGMLVEEQRTNLFLQSADFGTSWTASNVTVTTNTTNSPANTTTADTITPAASTAVHGVQQSVSVSASTAYIVSVFVKGDGAPLVQVSYDNGASVGSWINVDLSNGSITRGPELSGGATNVTGGVDSIGNGWYRIRIGATHTGTTSRVIIQPLPSGQSLSGINPSTTTAITDKIIVWGAQLEAGAFATSYIATTTASATRSADVASVNTLSPWYNASSGTLFAEGAGISDANARYIASINDGTINEFYGTRTNANLSTIGIDGGSTQWALVNSYTSNNTFKSALAYAVNDIAFTTAGSVPVTDVTATLPTVTQMQIGTGPGLSVWCGYIRRITYYPRRLSNTELQSITT